MGVHFHSYSLTLYFYLPPLLDLLSCSLLSFWFVLSIDPDQFVFTLGGNLNRSDE